MRPGPRRLRAGTRSCPLLDVDGDATLNQEPTVSFPVIARSSLTGMRTRGGKGDGSGEPRLARATAGGGASGSKRMLRSAR